MPLVNHAAREVHIKVVYYGPGLGGKTTNLEYIHRYSKPVSRGKLISLMTEAERTLFFDFLPMDLGSFRGYTVRMHLCTVPGQIAQDATRRLILRHVDGVVFVADSQSGRISENQESIQNLETNLRLQGDDPDRMPLVVQYNKRDLVDRLPVTRLAADLGVPDEVPQLEASALQGWGVFATLKRVTTECLKLVGDPRRAREGRSPSVLPGKRASMYPGGRPPALESVVVPRAPAIPRVGGMDD